eukprot:8808449-Pyramimonas_sp.AAC.1
MRRQWERLFDTTAETLRTLGPPAQWSGLGCNDEAKWRTVLSAICWGTCTVQLEEQMRQVFTRSLAAHRLFAPFNAYWTRHPPAGTRSLNGRSITSKSAALSADAARAHLQEVVGRNLDAGGPTAPFSILTTE